MTKAKRETFLGALRVGVLAVADDSGGAPSPFRSGTATNPAAMS